MSAEDTDWSQLKRELICVAGPRGAADAVGALLGLTCFISVLPC